MRIRLDSQAAADAAALFVQHIFLIEKPQNKGANFVDMVESSRIVICSVKL